MKHQWSHSFEATVPGTRQQVFSALTTPAELIQWFAEHVDVEPRAGGRFRFWGRHSYGTPSSGDATQHCTHFESNRALAFTWCFDGQPTEVHIQLDEADDPVGTRVRLNHQFSRELTQTRGHELVDDLWRLTIGNLDAHLRGGTGVVRVDFTDPQPQVRLSIEIDASRERVFSALMDPSQLNAWIASAAAVERHVGGRYSYGWKYKQGAREVEGGPTQILELVPNERLVTDWPDWRGDPTAPSTRVTWLLESLSPERTKVTLIHSGFARAADIGDYPFGWEDFLHRLKSLLARVDLIKD
jgi:uncharacterized protein YndB with AHSA1/START domain